MTSSTIPDPTPGQVWAATSERCTSNVNVPALGGSGIVVWCAREPHYANGPHRASVPGTGRRPEDAELRAADVVPASFAPVAGNWLDPGLDGLFDGLGSDVGTSEPIGPVPGEEAP